MDQVSVENLFQLDGIEEEQLLVNKENQLLHPRQLCSEGEVEGVSWVQILLEWKWSLKVVQFVE